MRFLCAAIAIAFAWPAANAFAQDDNASYGMEISAGQGYEFAGSALPSLQPQTVERALSLSVSRWNWTLAYEHSESDEDDEGDALSISYGLEDHCFAASLGCSAGVRVGELGETSYVTYSAELTIPWSWGHDTYVEPAWSIGGEAVTGDRSESVVSATLAVPIHTADKVWELELSGGASYAFESEETEPTWGATLTYTFNENVSLSVGYESTLTFDDTTPDGFEVDRRATATVAFAF